MFGLEHNLDDPSLYILHDILERQLEDAEEELSNCSEDQIERINILKSQVEHFKMQLSDFKLDIANKRKNAFQFSIEELYLMYGQYERRFIGIEFHRNSEAENKFGRSIGGILVYSKNERETLDRIINSENIPRTNGFVKIEVTSNYNLTKEQYTELSSTGFLSGDIYEISATNLQQQKSFRQEGLKEVPHTINIEFDPTGIEYGSMELWLLSKRVQNGGKLLDFEWSKLCGYSLYFKAIHIKKPSQEQAELIRSKCFDEDGNKYKMVRFYELTARLYNQKISEPEMEEYFILLRERTSIRLEILKDEIKRSTNKTVEQFNSEFPIIYKSIINSLIYFEEDVLEYHQTNIPIYWDFRSYLHIYLRHCKELEIEGHFEDKTKFQYTPKDIRRILCIAISDLHEKINERLSNGSDFRIYGDKSLYFNGNYYSLRIENNGRVDSFYPLNTI